MTCNHLLDFVFRPPAALGTDFEYTWRRFPKDLACASRACVILLVRSKGLRVMSAAW